MSADILLVTGARALLDSSLATAWARGAITEAFDTHRPAKLVTGDARGPDEWARHAAVGRRVAFYCYAGNGEITGMDGRRWGRWTKELAPEGGANRAEWGAWFLHRDRVMVQHVARRAREGATVVVLALRAPWSSTNGTGYTVDRARAAGLVVVDLVCNAGLAPPKVTRER